MSTDERKQTEALLVFGIFVCLWLSHFVAINFPDAPGNFNLRQWLWFWNKPLWINWPASAAFFAAGIFLGKRFNREIRIRDLAAKEKEAAQLTGKGQAGDHKREFRPIL
ncbi:MAG: hypothetical protein PHV34_19095 [Verrucomicrobiae bacterium]|nr:hypothetical protein [Verrucomicrobiae bacterium]